VLCLFVPSVAFIRKARADGRPVGVVFRGHHEAPGGRSGPVRRTAEPRAEKTGPENGAEFDVIFQLDTRKRASEVRFTKGLSPMFQRTERSEAKKLRTWSRSRPPSQRSGVQGVESSESGYAAP
jgi:hypothetical protein